MNADRQQHHHEEPRRKRSPVERHAPAREEAPADEPTTPPAPVTETHAAPEGTFAASQLAERLRLLEANLRAISTGQKPWAPPQSELNLRDRTV